MRAISLLCSSLISLSFVSPIATAQPDAQQDGQHDAQAEHDRRLRSLIEQLGSEHWIDRDLAMRDLGLFADEFSLEDFERALTDPNLTLDQQYRLRALCANRFADHPKGGLGITFGPAVVGAIEVVPMEPNDAFPASKILNPGDRIAMVDQMLLRNTGDLRAHILSRDPNELLPVLVYRGKKLIEFDLPLGAYDRLTGAAMLEPKVAREALALRWSRRGVSIAQPDIVGIEITDEQWINTAFAHPTPDGFNTQRRSYQDAVLAGTHSQANPDQNLVRRIRGWKSLEHGTQFMIQSRSRSLQARLAQYRAQRTIYTKLAAQIELKLESEQTDQLSDRLIELRSLSTELLEKIEGLEAQIDPKP